MARNIMLSRSEAELLDDALLMYARSRGRAPDGCMLELSGELCRIWGMTHWHERDNCQDLFQAEGHPA